MQKIVELQELVSKKIKEKKYSKYPEDLYDPLDYIMSLGGKRMRPVLVLLAHHLYSDNHEEALDAAIAVETFHNFSLIHDDIMDAAPIRRGKPTVHEKWNQNTAILSGDVMLIEAYELFVNYPKDILPKLLKLFNKTAIEVCEGQQIDMLFETQKNVKVEEYIKMIELKTAVLLGCSLEIGAIIANAPAEDAQMLYEFGRLMGIAFQLQDDYLDVYANPEKFGKQVGGDIISNKKTFLWIEAHRLANEQQSKEIAHWESIQVFKAEDKVSAITKIYNDLNIPQLTENKIKEFANQAFGILEKVKGKESVKELLVKLSEDLLVRES
ncbi:MAG: polyprenyl synthetase family protein [Sphingobacteriales bacterium]|nr:polyprenyl synthetase family protein [Sphingobacteriales bacterium]